MSKKLYITLLILVSFLVLGFSITANAAKPNSEQYLVSAPLYAGGFLCSASNLTDSDRNVTFTFFYDGYTPESFTPPPISPGSSRHAIGVPPSIATTYCIVEWFGKPGDVKASICGYFGLDLTQIFSCLELN